MSDISATHSFLGWNGVSTLDFAALHEEREGVRDQASSTTLLDLCLDRAWMNHRARHDAFNNEAQLEYQLTRTFVISFTFPIGLVQAFAHGSYKYPFPV